MEFIQGRQAFVFELEPPPSLDEDSFNQLSVASGRGNNTPPLNANAVSGRLGAIPGVTSTLSGGGSGGGDTGRTNLDVFFDAALIATTAGAATAPARSGGGTETTGAGGRQQQQQGTEDNKADEKEIDIGVFLGIAETGVSGPGGVGPLQWGWISPQEARVRAKRLYREAAHAQVHYVCMLFRWGGCANADWMAGRGGFGSERGKLQRGVIVFSRSRYPREVRKWETSVFPCEILDIKTLLIVVLGHQHTYDGTNTTLPISSIVPVALLAVAIKGITEAEEVADCSMGCGASIHKNSYIFCRKKMYKYWPQQVWFTPHPIDCAVTTTEKIITLRVISREQPNSLINYSPST